MILFGWEASINSFSLLELPDTTRHLTEAVRCPDGRWLLMFFGSNRDTYFFDTRQAAMLYAMATYGLTEKDFEPQKEKKMYNSEHWSMFIESVNRGDYEDRKNAAHDAELTNIFRMDLAEALGLQNHPKRGAIIQKAYEFSNGSGLCDWAQYARELTELVCND